MSPPWRRVGRHGLLIDAGDLDGAQRWHAAAQRERAAGRLAVSDIVPAATTVLLDGVASVDAVAASLASWELADAETAAGPEVVIPVAFDGPDLDLVAAHWGVSAAQAVQRLVATELRAAFGGFAPGFTYLTGLPSVPRRDSPRTRVPAGSVALAGGFAGVYPRVTPGGWQLVGRTDAVVWDPHRSPPALIAPGARVRFVEAEVGEAGSPRPVADEVSEPACEVIEGGPHITVQDLGRPGVAHLGVPRSGAADEPAHRAANAAVGNPAEAATLEAAGGAVVLRARRELVLACAGPRREAFVGGVPAPWGAAFRVAAGQVVEVGPVSAGLRAYVAVRGGIDAPPVLGSRATDTLSGLGPGPLSSGTALAAGPEPSAPPVFAASAQAARADDLVVPILPGPRADWFAPEALEALVGTPWEVTGDVSRVGTRLSGPTLARARDDELPTEGMVRGAVQVPPSGQPVVFGPDHPVTGGYPVIAVTTDEGLARMAQAAPGDMVRFVWAD